MVNHYQVLGLPNFASVKEVRKAYIIQIRKYHPDVNPSPQAEELSKHLNVAKEALETEQSKASYDWQLRNFLERGQRSTYTQTRPAPNPISPEEERRRWRDMMAERKARIAQFKAKRDKQDYIDGLKYIPINLRYGFGGVVYCIGLFLLFAFPLEINFFFLFGVSIPLFIGSTIVASSAYNYISTFNDIRKLPYDLEKRTLRGILLPTVLPLVLAIIVSLAFGSSKSTPDVILNEEVSKYNVVAGSIIAKREGEITFTYMVNDTVYSRTETWYNQDIFAESTDVSILYPIASPEKGVIVPIDNFETLEN